MNNVLPYIAIFPLVFLTILLLLNAWKEALSIILLIAFSCIVGLSFAWGIDELFK